MSQPLEVERSALRWLDEVAESKADSTTILLMSAQGIVNLFIGANSIVELEGGKKLEIKK